MKQPSISPTRKETKHITMTFELKKDLQENEVVCQHCHGTGLEIRDNVYGIRDDTIYIGVHFPYKHQSLTFCKHCFNGVMKRCPGCGTPRGRRQYDCPCGYDSAKRSIDWEKQKLDAWEKTNKISQDEAFKRFDCLYIENLDRYVFDEGDLECAIDDYMYDTDMDENIKVAELRVYGTAKTRINIDAGDIIERACEDLHEYVHEKCNIKELQSFLDAWCDKQYGTDTYHPDMSTGVILKSE